MEISVVNRTAASARLQGWCYSALDADEMEVCEWSNGEGFDVVISHKNKETRVELTWGEWELLTKLVRTLQQ